MVVNKRDIPRYELQSGDVKIKQKEKFNYQEIVITEIRRCIEVTKHILQNISNVLRKRKISVESKSANCYVIPIVLWILHNIAYKFKQFPRVSVFIIGAYNLNDMKYADDTVLVVDKNKAVAARRIETRTYDASLNNLEKWSYHSRTYLPHSTIYYLYKS